MRRFDDLVPTTSSATAGVNREYARNRVEQPVDAPSPASKAGAVVGPDWLTENTSALQDSNRFVERHGLPLERYRNF